MYAVQAKSDSCCGCCWCTKFFTAQTCTSHLRCAIHSGHMISCQGLLKESKARTSYHMVVLTSKLHVVLRFTPQSQMSPSLRKLLLDPAFLRTPFLLSCNRHRQTQGETRSHTPKLNACVTGAHGGSKGSLQEPGDDPVHHCDHPHPHGRLRECAPGSHPAERGGPRQAHDCQSGTQT